MSIESRGLPVGGKVDCLSLVKGC